MIRALGRGIRTSLPILDQERNISRDEGGIDWVLIADLLEHLHILLVLAVVMTDTFHRSGFINQLSDR